MEFWRPPPLHGRINITNITNVTFDPSVLQDEHNEFLASSVIVVVLSVVFICLVLHRFVVCGCRREYAAMRPITIVWWVQFCVLCFIILNLPLTFYRMTNRYIWNFDLAEFTQDYAFHTIGNSCVFAAFCLFALLWVESLGDRGCYSGTRRVAVISCAVLVSGFTGLSIWAVKLCFSQDQLKFFDSAVYKALLWATPVCTVIVSAVLLIYGTCTQVRLKAIYSNTGWQRGQLRKLNRVVVLCTLCGVLRSVMITLLYVEQYRLVGWHYFLPTSSNDVNTHPFLWQVLSNILPNYGLCSLLLVMTQGKKPASTRNVTSPGDGALDKQLLANTFESFSASSPPPNAFDESPQASLNFHSGLLVEEEVNNSLYISHQSSCTQEFQNGSFNNPKE
eukprot:CAMPEP_0175146932 /NCGR_PEP_ID=MMETSP0087-20121206/15672_1 /TAXON_ID=136419 /ORGANISM="Unknown Unknown, Strain D1" /LENGTH=390 /DNA_ID=CAMNT_0016431987 /DNA_START=18 /DNA_END=1190 /DNA_ORIENTATION=-